MPTPPKVVLSTGLDRVAGPPRPATLFVSAELGHSFRALPPEEQRRAVEGALADALVVAFDKIEAINAPADVAEEVAA